jgi:DNA-binding NtrC family response regulator
VRGEPAVQVVVHRALEPGRGTALGAAELTDQQRLAVLLQGSGLLAVLRAAGWRLAGGWQGARVDGGGLLSGLAGERGAPAGPAQRELRELLLALFAVRDGVPGRGEARRAARELLAEWRQELAPVDADAALVRLLEAAPFLWREAFGPARAAALVGAHTYGRFKVPWVAGPRAFRERCLARAGDRAALGRLLASAEARELWRPEAAGEAALELAAVGRWSAALAAWERRPPADLPERLAEARALMAVGRHADALGRVSGVKAPEARVLRVACLARLGRLASARRALRRLAAEELAADLAVEAAEVAARVLGSTHDEAGASFWVERALAAARGPRRLEARLVAASAAWDRGDLEAMDRLLGALPEPQGPLAWRWRQVRSWRALADGDGDAAVAELTAALGERRRIGRSEAAGLWNDLGLGRAVAGDLAGAERACRHAARLQRGTQGPRATTLFLFNLAEIRLRRGHLDGVREALDRSAAENRAAGNRRGEVQDVELAIRWDLTTGRPEAALGRARAQLAEMEARGEAWRRPQLLALAARALGWLERGPEALEALAEGGAQGLSDLEPEERPAVWALAGDRERALAAAGGPTAGLWRSVLTGEGAAADWSALDALEPYRAARTIFDLERVAPGVVPATCLRAAQEGLRAVGASRFAEELEERDAGPWQALERYLRGPEPFAERAARLLRSVRPEARLGVVRERGERPLVPGPGGTLELAAEAATGGRLRLRVAADPGGLAATFLALLARDLPPAERGAATSPAPRVRGFVGESPTVLAALERLARLALAEVPILLQGETGTGKELAARQVHASSSRSAGPFVPLNCAELSESLILSELFGHVRGAFTGAERDRTGIFEAARRGTVFLDEIGDLPLAAQGKLLRVLQEGEVRRLGESLPRPVDVRLVAATHRDLAAMVRRGEFREDLYYRLKVASVTLPPLRERGEDVLLLAERFVAELGAGKPLRLAADARRRLAAHSWPGNVRELRNVLAVAAALAQDGTVRARDLELPDDAPPAGGYHQQVEALRRRLIADALVATGGNRAEAARRLGLSRQALSYLVRELGLA